MSCQNLWEAEVNQNLEEKGGKAVCKGHPSWAQSKTEMGGEKTEISTQKIISRVTIIGMVCFQATEYNVPNTS